MVLVIADNAEIERCIRRIVTLSETAGAEFSGDLVVKCIGGRLCIEAPPDSAGSELVRLPRSCLVPLRHFGIVIAGDKFVMSSHEPGLTDTCVATFEAMLELYNLTDKLAAHRRTSPWSLAASHPELLAQLAHGSRRDLSPRWRRYRDLTAAGDRDELDLQSFFDSRMFDYAELPAGPGFPVLLPILDAMNHHSEGEPFLYDDRDKCDRVLTVARSVPLPAMRDECFASYGISDCFDIWMDYGFIDDAPGFVRSLAMEIDVAGRGTIRISDRHALRTKAELPLSVSDLHSYIPQLLARRRNQIDVGSVLVPGPHAPRALRRTLFFLIAELSPGRPPLRELVLNAEHQVIAANTAYYQALADFLRAMPLEDEVLRRIRANFMRMCELQLGCLRDYLISVAS